MELSKNYSALEVESALYEEWLNKGYFNSTPDDREAFTVVIPPPNVTGILHMGHALNNTVQDILIRRAKLQGKNTCWVPGTDHASIATEAKVVAMLKERGIDKNTLSREEFLKYAWEWKEKYGGIILQQLKKLGCSLDWNRTAFTMDTDYYNAVIDVFIDLYNKGYIYRGAKMINWDPIAKTALSDEEVNFKETNSKLVYIKYFLEEDKTKYITVATVRPETILGDVAICVHPDDERYKSLVGKKCLVPLINRAIPIITDDYIDMEFGTGCLKVTPAHDINDYNLGKKHNLEIIDTLNEDGTLSAAAQLYIGQDRFDVRKKIVEDLQASGNLEKVEDYKNQVGHSERTNAVIEPRLSMQWWCKMDDLAKPALDAVMQDDIKFHPPKFKNTYNHWMSNIRDWCVSRQLWWGHRIPAWYDEQGNFVVAKTKEEALKKLSDVRGQLAGNNTDNQQLTADNIRQDEDVLDTWFSSWLWPLEVFGWNKNKNNKELDYYYPTATLVTAPEIIFFWVARMIMAGYEYKNLKPFDNVYFTGIVRDKQGRKMSKSLGNSPDLLKLIDDYGADGVRFGVMIASPAGNDILFDESSCEQGKVFCNKLWNAFKLLKIFEGKEQIDTPISFASVWLEERIIQAKQEVENLYKEFKLSEALKTIYSLIWDDYCSWYLEWIKTGIEEPISKNEIAKANEFFTDLMKMLHPFMPFITETIYKSINNTSILESKFSSLETQAQSSILKNGEDLKNIITTVRDLKVKNNLKPKDEVELFFPEEASLLVEQCGPIIAKQVYAKNVSTTPSESGVAFLINKWNCAMTTDIQLDTAKQKEDIQKDIDYYKGFLQSVEKKLSNEKFVANAKPEVVAIEQKKKEDALSKLKMLEESLRKL